MLSQITLDKILDKVFLEKFMNEGRKQPEKKYAN